MSILAAAFGHAACVPAVLGQTSLGVNRIRYVQATGTSSQSCRGLRGVLAAIGDASPNNPHVVKLDPGRYSCGSAPVVVGEGISIQGQGQLNTRISGSVDSPVLGVIHLAGSYTSLVSVLPDPESAARWQQRQDAQGLFLGDQPASGRHGRQSLRVHE